MIARIAVFQTGLGVLPRYPGWGFLWPLIVIGYGVSVRRQLRATAPFWSLAGAHVLGAVTAFLITPHDLVWHLTTALDRLLFHIAPVALLATLMAFETVDAGPHLPRTK